jgi:hypothetical protein
MRRICVCPTTVLIYCLSFNFGWLLVRNIAFPSTSDGSWRKGTTRPTKPSRNACKYAPTRPAVANQAMDARQRSSSERSLCSSRPGISSACKHICVCAFRGSRGKGLRKEKGIAHHSPTPLRWTTTTLSFLAPAAEARALEACVLVDYCENSPNSEARRGA